MTLKEYVELLEIKTVAPKRDFIAMIERLTGKEDVTVYRWINEESIPNKADRNLISDVAGIPVEELWPTLNEQINSQKK